ncbi:MAG: sigma-70 family RNA polymerase sigma factor [Candidatus Riflebacteria bacterium]|nr:sigma-70 family RNA polymerase sigma factor [Candidatus Riflebacteria bacterium]
MTENCRISNQSDEKVVEEFQKGSGKAFELIFDKYYSGIVRYISCMINIKEEARDIAQEVFLKVHGGLRSYKASGGFKAWILTIARRTTIDHLRKKHPETATELSVIDSCLSNCQRVPDNFDFSDDLFMSLNPLQREILSLKFVEELSYQEISEITGLPEGKLRKVVCFTLKSLREKEINNDMHKNN